MLEGGDRRLPEDLEAKGTDVNNNEENDRRHRGARPKGPLRELAETIIIALVIALLVRTFVVEVFVVEGRSMEGTLVTGDRLLVNKLVFLLRHPARGEIIVFRNPRDPGRDFIKRVVALPGEMVELRKGKLYINGEAYPEPYLSFPGERDAAPHRLGEDAVWVLGDNRNNSEDSRVFGEVPFSMIKGKAFLRFWPPSQWKMFAEAAGSG